MPLTGTVGGFGGAGGLSLRSDELSRLGKGPSGGDGAVPGNLISVGGEEGERCRAGSSTQDLINQFKSTYIFPINSSF